MHLHAYLAQATLPGLPPLLQLPHVSADAARKMETQVKLLKGLSGGDRWVQAFLAMSEEKRNEIVEESCEVGETEIAEMVQVARFWPTLDILESSFKGTSFESQFGCLNVRSLT